MQSHRCHAFVALLFSSVIAAPAEDSLPKTLMTTRGKLLVTEDFARHEKFPALRAALPVKLDEWHTVVVEIRGEGTQFTLPPRNQERSGRDAMKSGD